jgi:hypothetical protein
MLVINEQKFYSKCHKYVNLLRKWCWFTKFSLKMPVKITLKIQASGMDKLAKRKEKVTN